MPARYNLGACTAAAKGTRWDYLAHPSVFPVQIMASARVFAGVVKTETAGFANLRLNSPDGDAAALARQRFDCPLG